MRTENINQNMCINGGFSLLDLTPQLALIRPLSCHGRQKWWKGADRELRSPHAKFHTFSGQIPKLFHYSNPKSLAEMELHVAFWRFPVPRLILLFEITHLFRIYFLFR